MQMRLMFGLGMSALLCSYGVALGQERNIGGTLLPSADLVQVQVKDPQPPQPKKEAPPPDVGDPFAAAPQTTSSAPSGVNHHMIGDFPGFSTLKIVTTPTFQYVTFKVLKANPDFRPPDEGGSEQPPGPPATIEVPVTVKVAGVLRNVVRVPSAAQGSFKIGENESPIPQDRCFFTVNYFNNVRGLGAGGDVPRTESSSIVVDGVPVPFTFFNPGAPPVRLDVQRQVFGFEKTFLDGDASFGVRVPFFQQHGDGSYTEDGLGDISMILKYALLYDRLASNVFTVGFVCTIPTGSSIQTVNGRVHPTLLQPFIGGLWSMGDFFVQGFSSVVCPTDSRDVTLAFNDISFGYWLYRGLPDEYLRSIVPVVELHVTTPLTNRSELNPIFVPDMFICTGGVHFGLGTRSVLTLGAASPVSGPQPFGYEGIVQFNYYY